MKLWPIILGVSVVSFLAFLFILGSTQTRVVDNRVMFEISALDNAFERYRVDYGQYPSGDSDSIGRALSGENSRDKVYYNLDRSIRFVEGKVLDPWNRPYHFSYTPEGFPHILSHGADPEDSSDDYTNYNN
jgi:type II secretory pathway pseudopilin PulG